MLRECTAHEKNEMNDNNDHYFRMFLMRELFNERKKNKKGYVLYVA